MANLWGKPHLSLARLPGFSDAGGTRFALLPTSVCEEVSVCLRRKPLHKHRAPPSLGPSAALTLRGSALENKCLVILSGSLGSPDILRPRLDYFGVRLG